MEPGATYTALSSPATPFPPADLPHHGIHRHSRDYERIVHQIHFKICTHANNERYLYIEEIPATGISKSRDPENFFYGLSGNWDWSCQTAEYWRHFFELPLVHGNNPFRSVAIDHTQPPEPASSVTTLATLARQISESLTAARASGELSEVWQYLDCPSAMPSKLFRPLKEAPHPDPALLNPPELATVSKIYSNSCKAIHPLSIHKKNPASAGCVCVTSTKM